MTEMQGWLSNRGDHTVELGRVQAPQPQNQVKCWSGFSLAACAAQTFTPSTVTFPFTAAGPSTDIRSLGRWRRPIRPCNAGPDSFTGWDFDGGYTHDLTIPAGARIFVPAGELVQQALAATACGGSIVIAEIHLFDLPAVDYGRRLFSERDFRTGAAQHQGRWCGIPEDRPQPGARSRHHLLPLRQG
jgi:hypothetical protein